MNNPSTAREPKRLYLTCLAVLMALAVAGAASAQEYPTRPMRLVVPFTPGGSTDILARLIAQKLTEAWGQQMVIDNRPGAGGNVGVELVARSAPDGYTLVMGHIGTFGVNPSLYPKLPYDPIRDFQPITQVAMVPNILVVNPSLPVKSVKDLIALAQAKPGALNYGSAGNGSGGHLVCEYFKLSAKVDIVHIPYRGTAPAMTDLMAGQTSMMFSGVPAALTQVKAGKLRGLAVATAKRLTLLPEYPTVAESGLPGFEATQWFGLLAPARTPKPVIVKLHDGVVEVLAKPEARERLAAEASEGVGSTPEQFGALIQAEIKRWAPVIKATGLKAE